MKLYYFDENDEEYKEYEPEKKRCSECIESLFNGGKCSLRGADGHACANFVQKGSGFETLCSKCSEFNKSCIGATDVTECKSFKKKEAKEEVDKEYFRKLFKENGGDNVKHPNHYNGTDSLECIDVIHFALGDDGFAYYCIGNIFKYLWRCDKKNGEEDLEKADQYLQFLEICKPYLSGPVADLAERISDLYEKESVI